MGFDMSKDAIMHVFGVYLFSAKDSTITHRKVLMGTENLSFKSTCAP
jgi:hypothetical protein